MAFMPRGHILALPQELVEEIIIIATALGHPTTAAALAQTCRHFRAAVYRHTTHTHLWRSMFLALFDDPRPALTVNALGASPSRPPDDAFPWQTEFQACVWTATYITTRADPKSAASADLVRATDTLLCTLSTALPLPSEADVPRALSHPIFPPLSMSALAPPAQSRNVAWLAHVLRHGFPPALTAKLLFTPRALNTPPRDEDAAFFRLLAHTGLMRPLRAPAHSSLAGAPVTVQGPAPWSSSASPAPELSDAGEDAELAPLDTTSIRRRARVHIYDISYLTRARHWGPFLPLAAIAAQDAALHSPSPDVDSSYAPSSASSPGSPAPARPRVDPESLFFDWAWIASARLVVEHNLRDLLTVRHPAVLRALMSLEGLRACSAPGVGVGVGRQREHGAEESDVGLESRKEKELGTAEELEGGEKEGDGWDWAGVEGQWRRCVCWLDYRELIANNMRSARARFGEAELSEVMRIIPLTIRIKSYGPPSPAWPGRPPIHVEGSLGADELALTGTVEMVDGGDVRWSLFSEREDGEGLWQSEGVQIGGVGSSAGVIGMWTGAEHEHMDPLGPYWAWKVGPTDGPVEGKALQLHIRAFDDLGLEEDNIL